MKNYFFISRDIVYIILNKNRYALIDLDDLDKVKSYDGKWLTSKNQKENFYYVQQNNPEFVSLHRLIMNTPKGMMVDHINHNTLDNRKVNLRNVTPGQNLQNLTSFKGYYFHKRTQKYYVKFRVNKKDIYGGSYDTKEEAYKRVLELRAELLPYSQEALLYKKIMNEKNPLLPTTD